MSIAASLGSDRTRSGFTGERLTPVQLLVTAALGWGVAMFVLPPG